MTTGERPNDEHPKTKVANQPLCLCSLVLGLCSSILGPWSLAWRRAGLLALALLGLAVATGSAGLARAAAAIVLYDGAGGATPDAQGWAYLSRRGSAIVGQAGGATVVDTTAGNAASAGYFASAAGFAGSTAAVPVLDRTRGYTIIFRARVEQEAHAKTDDDGDGVDDRAGFSAIVLGSDLRGIELGFWANRIWAQEGGSGAKLFTQAEGVPFDTTAALTEYSLEVSGDTYTLAAGGQSILAGPLRDYTAFDGFPDPYETPNLLFFGDDTTRARARFGIAYVAASVPGSDLPPKHVFVPLAERPRD
jgi:hypothetical protein